MMMKKWLVTGLSLMFALVANAAVPAGRLAFVNDASSSQDADDVAAIPFQTAMMAAFDVTDKLVHWSYNCDYTGVVITDDRVGALEASLLGSIDVWGDPVYGDIITNIVFDCRNTAQRTAAIAHLAARINESSSTDPLWIIEAGEPDVIGYALEAATQSKRQYVKVVTHHTHNDNGAVWDLEGNIAALPGMAPDFIVRIPDQNVNLKKPLSQFGWMTSSTDPRIEFLASRYEASTVWDWNPQPGTVDISDAGMLWYVLSGGPNGGGSTNVTPAQVGTKITTWAAAHPTAAPPPPPPVSDDYYMETNGLVVMDVEFVDPVTGWTEDTRLAGFTGSSYYAATGYDSFGTPGKSILTYKFAVTKSGNYQLQWRSAITDKNGGFADIATEQNDSWSQLLDASGKVVTPVNVASLDGGDTDSNGLRWYKTYTNEKNKWSWQAVNKDGGGSAIYWALEPGQVYQFRASLRSQGHALDRIILWDRSLPSAYGPEGGKPTSGQVSLCNAAPVSPIVQSGNSTNPPVYDFTYDALVDFPNITAGRVPYYKDTARGALAINASVVTNRDLFARASLTFAGSAGVYDVTLTALKETDGECPYQLLINGVVVGTATNSPTSVDYEEQNHVFTGITIPAGATISVESKSVTNGEVPEGDGTAYARGRWSQLALTATGSANDLAVSFNTPSGHTTVAIGTNLYVKVNATSTSGIEWVRLYKDSVLIRGEGGAPYEWNGPGQTNDVALQNLAEGSFVLTATARDLLGNEKSASITIRVGTVDAALIQHLDATVASSVTGSSVTQWADQSGQMNHAIPAVGSVLHPSASQSASGLTGLDFGLTANSLQLFSSANSQAWLDFTGAASTNDGFAVLVAFKCDALLTNNWNDLIGNGSAIAGFGMRYNQTGSIQAYLGGASVDRTLQPVQAGNTVVFAFNYDVAAGSYAFWDSKNGSEIMKSVVASNFSKATGVTLGRTDNPNRYFKGMVGEVKVFKSKLSSAKFQSERDALVAKWITGLQTSGYEAWAATNSIGAATADDDGDGRANLLEYAIGGNPKAGGDVDPVIVQAGSTLSYSYMQRNDDSGLSYILQGCTNLIHPVWIDLNTPVVTNRTAGEYDEVTRPIPLEDAHLYIRLKVNQQ